MCGRVCVGGCVGASVRVCGGDYFKDVMKSQW